MRLWSVHPKYLDASGLVALWREGLLAQSVIRGRTKGYGRHPQLCRFMAQDSPQACIARYLRGVRDEAQRRGYRFDSSKICRLRGWNTIPVTRGQVIYEWRHLLRKLKARNLGCWRQWFKLKSPEAHSLFKVVPGKVENWEKVAVARTRRGR